MNSDRQSTGPPTPVELSRTDPNGFAKGLFRGLPKRYDALGKLLSFGQDRAWRAATVARVVEGLTGPGSLPPNQALIADVATGTGGIALEVARQTGAKIVGVDITPEMLAAASAKVAAVGRQNQISLVRASAESLPFPNETFDALTFEYLLRYVADPAGTIAELARVLRPGGTLASMEFYLPTSPLSLAAWRFYTTSLLPAAGGVLGGRDWYTVGRFLRPSIEEHYRRFPLGAHTDAWKAAGMVDVWAQPMSLGGGIVMWGRKRR